MKSDISMLLVFVFACCLASGAKGTGLVITNFSVSGELSWAGATNGVFYTISRSDNLAASNAWNEDYTTLVDIQSTNALIAVGVPRFFRVCGNELPLNPPAPVSRTGIRMFYLRGDDFWFTVEHLALPEERPVGVPWPTPRFVDNNDETVTDVLTGLMWSKDANPFGLLSWTNALDHCNTDALADHDDWRLPSVRELLTLIDYSMIHYSHLSLPSNHPFLNVQNPCWSSTTPPECPDGNYGSNDAWCVYWGKDIATMEPKIQVAGCWPVRSCNAGDSSVTTLPFEICSEKLCWNNSATNVFYAVEYRAPSGESNAWTHNYSSLMDIRTTGSTARVTVPMEYRVICSSNRFTFPAPVAATGQTNTYHEGDDGDLLVGTVCPAPRFSDNGDGTVLDHLTGLMWTKDAAIIGEMAWQVAVEYCSRDYEFAGHDDWRMPNIHELLSLVDYGHNEPFLPPNHPFLNIEADPDSYWSSTTLGDDAYQAWHLDFDEGRLGHDQKFESFIVWPVRGGATR